MSGALKLAFEDAQRGQDPAARQGRDSASGPKDRLQTGSKPSAAEGDSHRQARPSNLDCICGVSRCRSRR